MLWGYRRLTAGDNPFYLIEINFIIKMSSNQVKPMPDYRQQAVIATRVADNENFCYSSISEMIEQLKPVCPHLSPAVVTQCFNGKRKECDGYTFKKVDMGSLESDTTLTSQGKPSVEDLAFTQKFIRSPKGKPANNLQNTQLIIENDPRIMGKLSYNTMIDERQYMGEPVKDSLYYDLASIVEEYLGVYSDQHITKAVDRVCRKNSYHPIQTVISNLTWDGTKRLETILIELLGAKDNKLNRALTVKWFYGLMKRQFEEGCNWDHMLVLHDKCGGTGKSTFPSRIALDEFCSSNIDIDNLEDKDNIALMNHSWIINFDELAHFDKPEMERIKKFLTGTYSKTRPAYGREVKLFLRHCVFFGSTNNDYFLRDYTDPDKTERRFWIVECEGEPHNREWWNKRFPDDKRDQVLAEAYDFYKKNPEFDYELTPEEDALLFDVQSKYKTANHDIELTSLIKSLTNDRWPVYWQNSLYSFKSVYKSLSNGDGIQGDVQIDAIPVDYVRSIFKQKTAGFITSAFKNKGWSKDIYMFNGEITECYLREGVETNVELNEDGQYVLKDQSNEPELF